MTELPRKFVAELVGTFYLCFIGAGAILVDHHLGGGLGLVGIALAHGLALSIAVSATMNISGGHINPAVTVTMLVCRQIGPRDAAAYIIAQLVGGTIAGVLLLVIYRNFSPEAIDATKLGTPDLAPGVGFGLGVLVEALLTFLLLFSIFGTAVDPRAPKIGGWGIGLTVGFDILMGGPITGASMNPARTFGTALPIGYFPAWHLVYWIGPILGGVLAGLVYTTVILTERERTAQ
ncbi:MAG: MIP/aquaporin family protein [Pirellulales bacterium]